MLNGVSNTDQHPGLASRKTAIEKELRTVYAGMDRAALKALPTLSAYAAYYKTFKKTYHVQLQLESIVLKGSPFPKAAALVEAMFLAELKNLLLTAGHDLAVVEGAPAVDVATGEELYTRLSGEEQRLKQGDMYIHDNQGVLSSILYGPDHRTRLTPSTTRALFTVYAPLGIGIAQMISHLEDLRDNVRLIAPDAGVEVLEVITASHQHKD